MGGPILPISVFDAALVISVSVFLLSCLISGLRAIQFEVSQLEKRMLSKNGLRTVELAFFNGPTSFSRLLQFVHFLSARESLSSGGSEMVNELGGVERRFGFFETSNSHFSSQFSQMDESLVPLEHLDSFKTEVRLGNFGKQLCFFSSRAFFFSSSQHIKKKIQKVLCAWALCGVIARQLINAFLWSEFPCFPDFIFFPAKSQKF